MVSATLLNFWYIVLLFFVAVANDVLSVQL